MSSWQNVAIPAVLVFTGIVLLTGDGLGVLSLDRIQNFWPLAIIVIGAMELPANRKSGMKKERG